MTGKNVGKNIMDKLTITKEEYPDLWDSIIEDGEIINSYVRKGASMYGDYLVTLTE